MAGQLTVILKCILAAGIISATVATSVTEFLEHQSKFDFKFKGIDFVGKIMEKLDGSRAVVTPCKNPGSLDIKLVKKSEASSGPNQMSERAQVNVCLGDSGKLELRTGNSLIVSPDFWKSCGIGNGQPSDKERTEFGDVILSSLNAFTVATVTKFLENQSKFNFKFSAMDFAGEIMTKTDGPNAATTSCKYPGTIAAKIVKTIQAIPTSGINTDLIAQQAQLKVCQNGKGKLELPTAKSLVISDSFWKNCGIGSKQPTDKERTEFGNAILSSLNALVRAGV